MPIPFINNISSITNIKLIDIPICSFLIVTLIILFVMYSFNYFKNIPCEKNMSSIFISNFLHNDIYHLLSNIVALYTISYMEEKIGYKIFFSLILFILIFNTICETILHNFNKEVNCSLGFSAVLFGLITYELITDHKIDIRLIITVMLRMLIPSIQNPKISLISHVIGAISGIIAGILFNKFIKL
jgi:membrane associated rhomboid family serine protease